MKSHVRNIGYIQKMYFFAALKELTKDFSFLNEINLKEIVFYCNLNIKNGKYSFFDGSIHLVNNVKKWEFLLPSVIHQLTHKYQHKKLGIVYCIVQFFLEKEAIQNELFCKEILNNKDVLRIINEKFKLLFKGQKINES